MLGVGVRERRGKGCEEAVASSHADGRRGAEDGNEDERKHQQTTGRKRAAPASRYPVSFASVCLCLVLVSEIRL